MKSMFRVGTLCGLLAVSGQAFAAEYHVAPKGDDAAPGTLKKPFATLLRAQQAAQPGDTIFLRGGIYRMRESQIAEKKGIFARLMVLDKSGAEGKPITYRAYPGEKPVFDCSLVNPQNYRITAFYVSGSWLRFQDIDVTGVQVNIKGHTQSICFESEGNNNIFERLTMHDGQAIGVYLRRGSNNLFLNCDAWNNWDSTSEGGKGGNVDGFGCHPAKGSTGNVFRGCRAWFNSDDGYDLINAHEPVVFENCWAFYNGFTPDFKRRADGNGFKAGGYGATPVNKLPNPIPRHIVRFCVAVGNKANGFYANHHVGGLIWLNNTAYQNAANFNMLNRLADNVTNVDGYEHWLRNNLGYKARNKEIDKFDAAKNDAANNSFDLDIQLTDADFASLDESELVKPRQPNGELPEIKFMHPSGLSSIVDKGVDSGSPFRGKAPDLGAWER